MRLMILSIMIVSSLKTISKSFDSDSKISKSKSNDFKQIESFDSDSKISKSKSNDFKQIESFDSDSKISKSKSNDFVV